MMSPRQVLFSSPNAEGVRVGAWWPHLMIVMPGVSPDQIGLMERSTVDVIQLNADRAGQSELVVKVPTWSDGRPAPPPR
jgi:hypothetical protein